MANPQEKLSSAEVSETSPLNDEDYVEDCEEEAAAKFCSCGCFKGVCLRWRRGRYLLHQQQDKGSRESWLKKRVKKLKEISEVMAGPKWKTFIRRFSVQKKRYSEMQFQYDPESYKLNFDDGIHGEMDGRDFSTRFVRDPAGL